MSIDVKTQSLLSVGANRTFRLGWNLSEETMLLTPDERSEWIEHALPPGVRKEFKLLQEP